MTDAKDSSAPESSIDPKLLDTKAADSKEAPASGSTLTAADLVDPVPSKDTKATLLDTKAADSKESKPADEKDSKLVDEREPTPQVFGPVSEPDASVARKAGSAEPLTLRSTASGLAGADPLRGPKIYLACMLSALAILGLIIALTAPAPCALCHKGIEDRGKLDEICRPCLTRALSDLGFPGPSAERIAVDGASALDTVAALADEPYSPPSTVNPQHPFVTIVTTRGTILIELYPESSPASVKMFLDYVRSHRYDETVVNRVEDFVVVLGGVKGGYAGEPITRVQALGAVPSEARNGLRNRKGAIGLPRSDDNPAWDSTFIHVNMKDNPHLDPNDSSAGYTVIGQVVTGWNVLSAMRAEPVLGTRAPRGYEKMPARPIRIVEAREGR